MLRVTKIISSKITDKKRIIKILRMGKSDVQTANEAMPFGMDSVPVKDLVAIHAETSEKGRTVIVGYINANQVAKIGENRLFSTNSDGAEQTFIYLRNNGDIEIGGNVDNMVRFTPLDSGLQAFVVQMQAELALIATGIAAGGGAYSPGVLNLDISASKIDDIKTK